MICGKDEKDGKGWRGRKAAIAAAIVGKDGRKAGRADEKDGRSAMAVKKVTQRGRVIGVELGYGWTLAVLLLGSSVRSCSMALGLEYTKHRSNWSE